MKSFKDYLTEGRARRDRIRRSFLKQGIKFVNALETGNKAQGVAANRKKNILRPILQGLNDRDEMRTFRIGAKTIPTPIAARMTTPQLISTAIERGDKEREKKAVLGISSKMFNNRFGGRSSIVIGGNRPHPTLRPSEN